MARFTRLTRSGATCRMAFTLLELIVVFSVIGLLSALLLSAVQNVRSRAARMGCENNLRQLSLAVHQFHETHQILPPGRPGRSDYGEPNARIGGLSWLAHCTPYLEQDPLWKDALEAYKADPMPWNDPPHRGVSTVVRTFVCPADSRLLTVDASLSPGAFTSYVGVEGGGGRNFDGMLSQRPVRLIDVTDGLSNTLMIAERPPDYKRRVGWWYCQIPGSIGDDHHLAAEPIISGKLPPRCNGKPVFAPGRIEDVCDIQHFWSLHQTGAVFAFGDGSVRYITYRNDTGLIRDLATRNGGEVIAEVP